MVCARGRIARLMSLAPGGLWHLMKWAEEEINSGLQPRVPLSTLSLDNDTESRMSVIVSPKR